MKTLNRVLFLSIFCIVGCVPSLHELYTKETVVYDTALLGDWEGEDTVWQFTGDPNDKRYTIVITEEDQDHGTLENRFEGRLVELSDVRYLDLFPHSDVKLNVGSVYAGHLLRAHTFWRVEIREGKLLIAAINPDFLDKLIEKDPTIVKHEKTQDTLVLTASPRELQGFIRKYNAVEGFFSDPIELEPKIVIKK
ncbi:MAG: hypothetical protein JXB18_04970 [Sedimentisphaerales bacterium]|nr:hypothetical protein [Sedimentisphaerales bacterium]